MKICLIKLKATIFYKIYIKKWASGNPNPRKTCEFLSFQFFFGMIQTLFWTIFHRHMVIWYHSHGSLPLVFSLILSETETTSKPPHEHSKCDHRIQSLCTFEIHSIFAHFFSLNRDRRIALTLPIPFTHWGVVLLFLSSHLIGTFRQTQLSDRVVVDKTKQRSLSLLFDIWNVVFFGWL